MEPTSEIPFCPLPPETISDVFPMAAVLGLFFLGGWLFRRWRKARKSKGRKQ